VLLGVDTIAVQLPVTLTEPLTPAIVNSCLLKSTEQLHFMKVM
jgi:hypothetical protein